MPTSIPISKTKIIAPRRRPELLLRARLLEEINACLDRKLILVSAPAGYGKTSLLVDLAGSTKLPICWLSLDPLDRDPQRFISYLVAALGERFPKIKPPLQPLLSNLRSIEEDAEQLMVTLTNELYEQVEEDFIFIIDDFHLLDGLPALSSLLNRFLQLVDDNCHVILATRTLPELPDLTLMIAREQTEGLGQAELAFQPREIQALFNQIRGEQVTEQAAQRLFEQSGGWITGIILSDLPGVAHGAGEETFTYLGQQVLDQQPADLREFLLRTSIPEEFNAELCEAMLRSFHRGRQNWISFINLLSEKNLFALPVGTDEKWIRYHPLFREFLQSRLAQERPAEIRPILEGLTTFYVKAGEWEKAYFTSQQLRDAKLMASVVERAGTPMLQHAFITLENWMNSLPPALTTTRPGLMSLRGGIAIAKGNFHEAIELLSSAEKIFRKNNDVEGLSLTLTRRAFAHRQLGEYEASLQEAEEALQLTESRTELQATYAEALRIKGANLYRLGHSREAVDYLEHSLALFKALKDEGSIPLLLVETGMVYNFIGEINAADVAYQKALKIWQRENNLSAQADVLNNLAILYHQTGDYERALEAFENALSLARRNRYTRGEAVILIGMGDLYAEVGDYVSAKQAYERALPITSPWPSAFIHLYLILAQANLAVLQGDPSLAQSILRTAPRSLKTSPSVYERGLWNLVEGRISLLKSQPDKAIPAFTESKASFSQDGRELESLWSRIWLAAALSEAGRKEPARAEMRELLGLRKTPNHGMLIMIGQAAPWLTSLQQDPEVGRNLNGLLERANRLNSKLPGIRRSLRRLAQSIEMPAARLVIRAFGRGEVRVDGRVVSSSEWSTQSVRDLFFYFLYRGGPATKEQIAAALWPEESDLQILKQRFKAYIFRLRRATLRDVILFDEEYYRFNYGLDYEYDVEAFETFLARARATREMQERIEHYHKAISLVQGPYLADVDMPWALGERERLEQVYIGALIELAELQLSGQQVREAISTAEQSLRTDPYREEVHQLLMRGYSALRDRAAIHRQYQACKSALAKLGLSPSRQTETLYHELLH